MNSDSVDRKPPLPSGDYFAEIVHVGEDHISVAGNCFKQISFKIMWPEQRPLTRTPHGGRTRTFLRPTDRIIMGFFMDDRRGRWVWDGLVDSYDDLPSAVGMKVLVRIRRDESLGAVRCGVVYVAAKVEL